MASENKNEKPKHMDQKLHHVEKIDTSKLNVKLSSMLSKDAIGEGKHGRVYVGNYEEKKVAIKQIASNTEKNTIYINEWINQPIENVKNVIGYVIENDVLYVLTDFFKNKKLSEYIDDEKNIDFPLKVRVKLASDIINGLQNIQKVYPDEKITDISTNNVFVNDSLGAEIKSPLMRNLVSKEIMKAMNKPYMHFFSPEEIKIEKLERINMKTYKWIIVYRIGCVLFHLITRKIPFNEVKSDYEIIQKIIKGEMPACKPDVSTNKKEFARLVALVHKCWNLDGSKRPTLKYIQKELKEISKKL
jgi:hypothetical protein